MLVLRICCSCIFIEKHKFPSPSSANAKHVENQIRFGKALPCLLAGSGKSCQKCYPIKSQKNEDDDEEEENHFHEFRDSCSSKPQPLELSIVLFDLDFYLQEVSLFFWEKSGLYCTHRDARKN